MRNYETVVIIRPTAATETELAEVIDKYTNCLTSFKSEISAVERWGLKKLAYLIKKESQGYYILIRYTSTPEAVMEMERLLRIDERILKYLTIRLNGDEAEVSLNDNPDESDDEESEDDADIAEEDTDVETGEKE